VSSGSKELATVPSKLRDLSSAVRELVHDGDTLVMEGFTHLIPFAAGHEVIRQRRRDLTLVRLTPDLIYDQMIAAGCCRKAIFSWAGNPGAGSLYGFRRAVEKGIPHPIEIEEYSHFGLAMRLFAGASGLPFMPLRSYSGSDLPRVNPGIRPITCPFSGDSLHAVSALTPDVAIVHVQRADEEGNAHVWGLLGLQREAAFASRRVIITAEEIVDTEVIRSDPNRTIIPAPIVSAVCLVPFGAHPSYAQGYYDRDTEFYVSWEEIARDADRLSAWLDEWVYGVPDRSAYARKLGRDRVAALEPGLKLSSPVNYGSYR
jgi:glutaconate CoA-transferase subunit A